MIWQYFNTGIQIQGAGSIMRYNFLFSPDYCHFILILVYFRESGLNYVWLFHLF